MEIRKISLLGHKDHGKSTLIGKMLMLTKSISATRIQEARKASNELGVKFEPAFLLDTFADERSGGMTFDNTRAQIIFKDVAFELIDVPGHEELIKSMLSGASNSQFSLVVVSSKKDEGITSQTRRHIYVSKLFGMTKYVIAVNKMDESRFDNNAFNSIKEDLKIFFSSIGLSDDKFSMVPISAYTGENIIKKSENMLWYDGNTLLDELIIKTNSSIDSDDNSGRILLQSSMKLGNKRALLGEVVSGHFTLGEKLQVFPGGADLKSFEFRKGNKQVRDIKKGDGVALLIDDICLVDVRGLVVVNDGVSINISSELKLKLFFADKPKNQLTMYLNNVGIHVEDLIIQRIIDPTTGHLTQRHDILPLDIAEVSVKLSKPVACVEFERCRELGRVVFNSENKFIAAGIITSVS